jgi:acyl-CoA reductase-like NAD-dependent aldehyde dehydrogenase
MVWAGLIGDLLPPGVLNIVNGFGLEAGKPLVPRRASPRSPSPARRRRGD